MRGQTQFEFETSVILGNNQFIDFFTGFAGDFVDDVAFLSEQITAIPDSGTLLLVGISLAGAAVGVINQRRNGGDVLD